MAAQLVAELQRPFEIDRVPACQSPSVVMSASRRRPRRRTSRRPSRPRVRQQPEQAIEAPIGDRRHVVLVRMRSGGRRPAAGLTAATSPISVTMPVNMIAPTARRQVSSVSPPRARADRRLNRGAKSSASIASAPIAERPSAPSAQPARNQAESIDQVGSPGRPPRAAAAFDQHARQPARSERLPAAAIATRPLGVGGDFDDLDAAFAASAAPRCLRRSAWTSPRSASCGRPASSTRARVAPSSTMRTGAAPSRQPACQLRIVGERRFRCRPGSRRGGAQAAARRAGRRAGDPLALARGGGDAAVERSWQS